MEVTKELGLKITSNTTFESDDIKETIVGYGENFKKIEKHLTESTIEPDSIATGQFFEKGKILWNTAPTIGDYVGWVNIREGYHATLWQPREYYTIGERIRAVPDNGNVYECVSAGRSMAKTPNFLMGEKAEFNDVNGNVWYPNYNYQVNDVVFATNGGKLFYYICETAGYTDSSEPSWTNVANGTTVIDGSVVWRKEATVKWKQVEKSCEFRPFGKIE